jgi:lipid-A-disaccharide synthase-like uncharacterized protein
MNIDFGSLTKTELIWLAVGLGAQATFMMRFVVQWIVSEIRGEMTIPVVFWYLSLIGSIGLLIYSIHREDLVFILGQTLGSFIYLRNLRLIYRKKSVTGD